MAFKISDLTPVQAAALRFLYDRRPADLAFNEYLDRRQQEASRRRMQDLAGGVDGNPLGFIHAHGSARNWVLDTFLIDPAPIRNEHPEHVAFVGLKCLLIYVAERMLRDGDLLTHLLCEAEAQDLLGRRYDLAAHLLRRGLYKTLIDHGEDELWSRYATPAHWTTPEGQIETLPSREVHEVAEICVFEGVVGITERLCDVLIRSIYAVVIALSDLTTSRLDEPIDLRY